MNRVVSHPLVGGALSPSMIESKPPTVQPGAPGPGCPGLYSQCLPLGPRTFGETASLVSGRVSASWGAVPGAGVGGVGREGVPRGEQYIPVFGGGPGVARQQQTAACTSAENLLRSSHNST